MSLPQSRLSIGAFEPRAGVFSESWLFYQRHCREPFPCSNNSTMLTKPKIKQSFSARPHPSASSSDASFTT